MSKSGLDSDRHFYQFLGPFLSGYRRTEFSRATRIVS